MKREITGLIVLLFLPSSIPSSDIISLFLDDVRGSLLFPSSSSSIPSTRLPDERTPGDVLTSDLDPEALGVALSGPFGLAAKLTHAAKLLEHFGRHVELSWQEGPTASRSCCDVSLYASHSPSNASDSLYDDDSSEDIRSRGNFFGGSTNDAWPYEFISGSCVVHSFVENRRRLAYGSLDMKGFKMGDETHEQRLSRSSFYFVPDAVNVIWTYPAVNLLFRRIKLCQDFRTKMKIEKPGFSSSEISPHQMAFYTLAELRTSAKSSARDSLQKIGKVVTLAKRVKKGVVAVDVPLSSLDKGFYVEKKNGDKVGNDSDDDDDNSDMNNNTNEILLPSAFLSPTSFAAVDPKDGQKNIFGVLYSCQELPQGIQRTILASSLLPIPSIDATRQFPLKFQDLNEKFVGNLKSIVDVDRNCGINTTMAFDVFFSSRPYRLFLHPIFLPRSSSSTATITSPTSTPLLAIYALALAADLFSPGPHWALNRVDEASKLASITREAENNKGFCGFFGHRARMKMMGAGLSGRAVDGHAKRCFEKPYFGGRPLFPDVSLLNFFRIEKHTDLSSIKAILDLRRSSDSMESLVDVCHPQEQRNFQATRLSTSELATIVEALVVGNIVEASWENRTRPVEVILRLFASPSGVVLHDPFVPVNSIQDLEESDWFVDTMTDTKRTDVLRIYPPRKLFKECNDFVASQCLTVVPLALPVFKGKIRLGVVAAFVRVETFVSLVSECDRPTGKRCSLVTGNAFLVASENWTSQVMWKRGPRVDVKSLKMRCPEKNWTSESICRSTFLDQEFSLTSIHPTPIGRSEKLDVTRLATPTTETDAFLVQSESPLPIVDGRNPPLNSSSRMERGRVLLAPECPESLVRFVVPQRRFSLSVADFRPSAPQRDADSCDADVDSVCRSVARDSRRCARMGLCEMCQGACPPHVAECDDSVSGSNCSAFTFCPFGSQKPQPFLASVDRTFDFTIAVVLIIAVIIFISVGILLFSLGVHACRASGRRRREVTDLRRKNEEEAEEAMKRATLRASAARSRRHITPDAVQRMTLGRGLDESREEVDLGELRGSMLGQSIRRRQSETGELGTSAVSLSRLSNKRRTMQHLSDSFDATLPDEESVGVAPGSGKRTGTSPTGSRHPTWVRRLTKLPEEEEK